MIHKNEKYRRMQRRNHIERKKKILKAYMSDGRPKALDSRDIFDEHLTEEEVKFYNDHRYGCYVPYYTYTHDGMLNKGKIHCSCQMCAFHGVPQQDKRHLLAMLDRVDDAEINAGVLENRMKKMINR